MAFPRRFFFSICLLSTLFFFGCSPLYLIRAAYEEGKILWRREPITRQLQDSGLAPELREKLKLVLEVREYARDVVKLRVGGSYSSISYVDRPDLVHVLMAVPKTDLRPYTWWYLFVGEVPYKGFFSKEAAEAEAQSLQARGYDTAVRSSPAFSTLGWFDDPLLTHLLDHDRVTLVEVIFHELFHNTLFVKGAVDFNESLANFVGNQAAVRFFRERYGEEGAEHRTAAQRWKEEKEFSAFLNQVAESLRDLYAKDLPEREKVRLREEIFVESRGKWSKRTAQRPNHRFRSFVDLKLNNAVIVQYLIYLKGLELFERVYEQQGRDLARFIETVRKAVDNGDEPFAAVHATVPFEGS